MAERIRWGIAGTGVIAAAFAEDLRLLDDAELVAVGSRSQQAADRFADAHGAARRHVGYDALAADPEVDAIYVAVPHTGHEEVTLTALAAGKAVLCEKPFAINAAQTERMIAAARAAGVFLMEAMWVRFLPHQVGLRELISAGRIGEIRSLIVDRGEVLSSDPAHRVLDPALGGGALLDLGIYPVSFASMLLGTPDRVAAFATQAVTGVDAQTSAVFGYRSGAQALISTALDARTANTASITGTKGRIDIADWADGRLPAKLTLLDGTTQNLEFPREGKGLRFQAAEVGRCLRAGETESPVMPLDETLSIMRTLDLMREQIGLRYPGE
ncbi:MAG TPA: Gfo/Idh/MocA family oxidoreductase [Actinocrinis sp.]|uniref:Gfo/Idh/MocA family protein n=1 Tax=Actinocrinis sp. TaxID=1920516 RepID=UPI002D51712D|nr:Gfo/Idh/MocA family oxidoreductase [Actinocrinis sp.]HZU55089.1 Gfo/Idh/MocA family oxidoreductase [Actinocrinis sp.]